MNQLHNLGNHLSHYPPGIRKMRGNIPENILSDFKDGAFRITEAAQEAFEIRNSCSKPVDEEVFITNFLEKLTGFSKGKHQQRVPSVDECHYVIHDYSLPGKTILLEHHAPLSPDKDKQKQHGEFFTGIIENLNNPSRTFSITTGASKHDDLVYLERDGELYEINLCATTLDDVYQFFSTTARP